MSNDHRKQSKVTPRRLELSLSPEDGSLQTAPLSKVLLTATDGLYTDLYNAAHGEIEVTTAKMAEEDDGQDAALGGSSSLKKEKMSNLSFAQRRNELGWRLAQHGKSISHVAALTAACHSTDFAQATVLSTKALKHARTAWVQADEAQDALYFFHAQLFPARQAPHDVYGALDLLKSGEWKDLPTDLRLIMDPYEKSEEYQWSAKEVKERWHLAVRRKLMLGELGWMKRNNMKGLWTTGINGGVVRLTYGEPKTVGSLTIYPIEARLTVLSLKDEAEWVLLSVNVHTQAKTGESNHQLDPSHRQQFDLHRLCAKAMASEERDATKESDRVSRPLNAVFQVAQTFSLSWQLEILSSQAQALRKGVWAATSNLVVTPVQFYSAQDGKADDDMDDSDGNNVLGVIRICFWRVDDRYGPPSIDALNHDSTAMLEKDGGKKTSQLSLIIRAIANVGVQVCLSGGLSVRQNDAADATVKRLVEAASDPFALSVSNALLAATTICAQQKCRAIADALRSSNDAESALPEWITVSAENASICVSATISYGATRTATPIVLFRLGCDARTGGFICVFSRSTDLLRKLSSNDVSGSNTMALRQSKLPRRQALANATGRAIRDAFDGLTRSMNVLATRTGVGGKWNDVNEQSASLRERAILVARKDVRASMISCCSVAAVYGFGAIAMSLACGVDAAADM